MEYKNMREIYKGNIREIKQPEFIGSDRFGDYNFKFDKIEVINLNKEYMFIKDGCYLYEIISGYVFPFFKTLYEGRYGINSEYINIPKYVVLDDLYEAQLIEVKEYIEENTSQEFVNFMKTLSVANKYSKIPERPDFKPYWEIQNEKESNLDIFPKEEKKEFQNSLISEHYQTVEMLLNILKDNDYDKYLIIKNKLDNIIEYSTIEATNIKNSKGLILYDKEMLDKIILNNLIRLEVEIELILKTRKFTIDGNVNLIYEMISDIKDSLGKEDNNILVNINKVSELYSSSINNISFVNQINIAKQISLLYLLAIKKYNIDSSLSNKIENTTYILNYKNYLYLLIRELLENGNIITNKYKLLISSEDVKIEDIIDIISDIEFVNKDIKKLELSK